MPSRKNSSEKLDKNLMNEIIKKDSQVEEESTRTRVPKFISVFVLMYTALQWSSICLFYEFPILFEDALIDQFRITPVEVGYFMAATYILPLFIQFKVGKMIERYGPFKSNLAIQSLMLFSLILAFVGLWSNSFWLICVSRGFYGICFSSLFIIIAAMGDQWASSWLTLFLGLTRSIANFFLSVFNYFLPLVYLRYKSLFPTLLLYALMTIISLALILLYLKVEKKYQKSKNKKKVKKEEENEEEAEGSKFQLKHIPKIPLVSKAIGLSMVLLPFCHRIFRLTAIDLIMVKFNKTYTEAKNPIALYPLTNMVLLLSFSFMFAAFGKKSFGLVAAAIGYVTSNLILLLSSTEVPNWVIYSAFVVLGFSASSFRTCSWASFLLTLPKQACTVMMGFLLQIQAFFIIFVPILIGFVTKDRTPQAYDNQIWMFLCLAGGFLVIYIWVCFYDLVYCDGMLTKVDSHKDVKEYKERVTSEMEEYLKGKLGPEHERDIMELEELGGDKTRNLNN